MTGTSMRGGNRRAEDVILCGSANFDGFVAQLHQGARRATLGALEHEQLIATTSSDGTLSLQFHGPQQRFTLAGVDREAFTQSLVPLMVMPRAHGLPPR